MTNVTAYCGGAAIKLTLPSSGTYTILVHASYYNIGSQSYTLSIQSPTGGGCNSTAIACGQSVSTNTSPPSEMDAYSYAGTAGETLIFALHWSWCYDGNTGTADIYGPSGQLVTNVTAYCGGAAIKLTLPSSGTYTILVHASYYNIGSQSYVLTIQSPTGGGCNSTPIACGQSVSANTSPPTEMDAYSYAGTAGQTLIFALHWSWCYDGNTGTADIYGPSGQWVTNVTAYCGGAAIKLTLPSSGTYTILVHASYFNIGSQSYILTIQSPTGGGCNSTPIACGQTRSANTGPPIEIDAYSYTGTAGQTLLFAFSWNYCYDGNSGTADIYGPSGQWVTNVTAYCGEAAIRFTLPSSGTYTILVHASAYRVGSVTYTLSLQVLGGCTQLILGQSVLRTEQVGCLPLQIVASSPAVWLSFTVQAPVGGLINPTINAISQFTNATIIPGTNSQWFVTMQTSPSNGVVGNQIIGSLCFTPTVTQSVFAPLLLSSLVVTNEGGLVPGSFPMVVAP